MRSIQLWTAVFAVALGTGPVVSQSLGDLARETVEQRKTIETPSKAFTNDDLRRGRPAPPQTSTSAPSTSPSPALASSGDSGAGVASDAGGDDATDSPGIRDEKYWRDRLAAAERQLERGRVLVDAVQSRINALNTDFVNMDDPAQRAIISGNLQRATAELGQLNTEIAEFTKAIADIREEARRAGAPPGWLR